MYDNNLPNLQPGQRIIVRHHNNGDTEYICRRDELGGFSSGFSGLFWLVVLAIIVWNLLPAAPADKSARQGRTQENTEVLVDR